MFGSMALLADGWHMATHAGALMVTALAYRIARRNAANPHFCFGTGKIGDLGAFASAVILGVVALLIGWESLVRLMSPVAIDFGQATAVAVIGLGVNLGSALLLHQGHGHDHPADNNLRAAYLHVLADALTSVLAIAALVAGRFLGWVWLDPVIGVLGALVIARWSVGLMRQAGAVLVDYRPEDDLPAAIRAALTVDGDQVTDLHVWQLGPGHHGAIVALRSTLPEAPARYRARLAHLPGLSHVTVEVNAE
jgi:cation diffusion facilitator family transporter